MTIMTLLMVGIGLLVGSGLPGLLAKPGARWGQRVAAGLMVLGSLLGLVATGEAVLGGRAVVWVATWGLPLGRLALAVDGVSVVFLVPVFLVPAVGAIYGLGYWDAATETRTSRRLGAFYGLLAGGMALVVIARDTVSFLAAWETMALAAFFLATTNDDEAQVCRAGWVYLIATHLGTLCLIAMFGLLHEATGSWAWTAVPEGVLTAGMASTVFVLGLIGFGVKAGLMPVHVWLPGAHANAPSHVSAVMSGVMLKMGVYGIVRLTGLLPSPPAWWGGLLLGLGAVSGLLGIAFAIGQSDLKRLLAYSSIENVGIIVMGVGLAVLGKAMGQPIWVVLGLAGALLHVWNHSLFKSLLFLNAGAVIHATGTREIDRLGGLAKRMPVTGAFFVLGAIAICGLPPLNGFASEYVIYQGLMRTVVSGAGPTWPAAALGAVALATIGALAVACFVRALGVVFLGEARTEAVAHAHEPGLSLLMPMAVLGGCCVALGLLPWLALPLVLSGVAAWAQTPALAGYSLIGVAPLIVTGMMGWFLLLLAVVLGLAMALLLRGKRLARAGTWDCGYARPTTRMQYTGSSFGEQLVGLFSWVLWPKRHEPAVGGALPRPTLFASLVPDTVLDRLVLPVFRLGGRLLPVFRLLQQGRVHAYLLYILGIIVALWLWGLLG